MAVDLQPGSEEIAEQQGPAGVLPHGLEQTFHFADVDLFLSLIEIENAGVDVFGNNLLRRNSVHTAVTARFRPAHPRRLDPGAGSSRRR